MKFPPRWIAILIPGLFLGTGCRDAAGSCANCGTVVVAAVGEPASLVPPLVFETVGRDITDQVFERFADRPEGVSPGSGGALGAAGFTHLALSSEARSPVA